MKVVVAYKAYSVCSHIVPYQGAFLSAFKDASDIL